MKNRQVYTYALVKSLYDQGEDYVDAFWPFVIKIFPMDSGIDLETIQRKVQEKFDWKIPQHVLETILNRAKRKGYIKPCEKRYELTQDGRNYLDILETEKEVERRINALIKDMGQFFNKRNVFLSFKQIQDLLYSFLSKNVESLVEFISPSESKGELTTTKPNIHEIILVDYIKTTEEQKPEHYKTLQDMVWGSLISAVLTLEDSSEKINIRNREFNHCKVFLDSNFVFSVLNLHALEFTEPAKELFGLLKKQDFELKVFDFTVDEICRVINGYLNQAYRYPATGVDTIYSNLKRKGWTKTDAREFIINIEDILLKEGIKVECTGINLDTYKPIDENLINLVRKYKPLQTIPHQNHDVASVEKIKEYREGPIRKIEESKTFFLTSDVRLSRLNFIDMGHKANGTISEVILDRLLTNILWLKDPNAKLSLKSIIIAYSRDLFIKRRIWDKFYDILSKLKSEGKINNGNISTLFFNNYIENVLKEFDESEADKITPEFALEEIEKASKLSEEKVKKAVKEKEEEFLKFLEGKISETEQKKDKEWLERIQQIKNQVREQAEKSSKKCVMCTRFLIAAILAIPIAVFAITRNWNAFRNYTGIASVISLILGVVLGSVYKLWGNFQEKLSNKIYIKKIKEVGLHKFK